MADKLEWFKIAYNRTISDRLEYAAVTGIIETNTSLKSRSQRQDYYFTN